MDLVISVAAVGRERAIGLNDVVAIAATDAVLPALAVDIVVAVVADDHVIAVRTGDLAATVIDGRGLAETLLCSLCWNGEQSAPEYHAEQQADATKPPDCLCHPRCHAIS